MPPPFYLKSARLSGDSISRYSSSEHGQQRSLGSGCRKLWLWVLEGPLQTAHRGRSIGSCLSPLPLGAGPNPNSRCARARARA